MEQSPHGHRQPRSIHTLNLGRYQESCGNPRACPRDQTDRTWNQRKIILMAILRRSSQLDNGEIEWCVKESVTKADQLDLLMQHYCRYDLNRDLSGNPI